MAASAVLYVKDLQSMRAFYESCFAMPAQHSSERFCVLASSDWELSLVRVADRLAASIVIADPPLRRENSPINAYTSGKVGLYTEEAEAWYGFVGVTAPSFCRRL